MDNKRYSLAGVSPRQEQKGGVSPRREQKGGVYPSQEQKGGVSPRQELRGGASPRQEVGGEHLYENVDLFKRSVDPFGEDFEAALKISKTVRVKKTSCSSFDSSEATSATPSFPATPTKVFDSASPPVPIKQCSRSTSRVSRVSVSSSGSDRTPHQRQYSYDEVSISSNFKKPVVYVAPPADKVYDVFNNISFSSPLTQLDDTTSDRFIENQERNMNSLESNLSSINLGDKVANYNVDCEDVNVDDPYENIEELRQSLKINPPTSTLKNPPKSAPEPPPRNSILKPGRPEFLRPDVTQENVYSECSTSGPSQTKPEQSTLFDRLMNEPSHQTSSSLQTNLGAKPKSNRTIDIRHTVSQWYDDAAEEVERDLSLDIQHLEKASVRALPRKPSYEHVFLATTGRLEQGEVVPPPTTTLLRDFDPCFDEEEDAKPVSSPQPVSSSQSVLGRHLVSKKPPSKPENKNCDVSQSHISDIKLRNGDIKQSDISDIKQSDRSVNTKNSETQPNKFPPGSPKKINFGPPKPPRNFDYATSPEEKRLSEIPEEPKKERKLKSPRDLLFNKSKKSRSPPKDRSSPDAKNCAVKKLDDIEDGPREENLYVTLPECKDDISGSPVNTPPPASTPPPLPSSLPPSATKPKQTMYENVWIERGSPPPVLESELSLPPSTLPPVHPSTPPTVPPRGDRAVRKAKLKNAQSERKVSHHSKSDSMDSGSSLSSHHSQPSLSSRHSEQSLCSLATTDSTNSKELVDGDGELPEKKKKARRLVSGRSFSVASIKLGKLPGLADNIKRRMSDQVKPTVSGLKVSSRVGGTPDDSDDDDDLGVSSDISPATRRSSVIFSDFRSAARNHSGAIFVLSRRKKQMLVKWCVLGEGLLKWFNEDTSLARPKESIMLNNIFTVSKREDKEVGPSQEELYCFDIAAISSKGKFTVYRLGCTTGCEREVWMEKMVQSLGTRLSTFSMVGVKRIGWAYLKAGFAAEWSLAWIYLADRHLVYATQDSVDFEKIDLKKTKDVFVRKDSKNLCLPTGFTKHPVLVCDFNDRSLYILVGVVDEVATWRSHIEDVAFTNNNILADQQVTHENVPVIVDKCVKFVFSHGVMTEGLYRKAGANTKINKLLAEFRCNAWAVQISRENYSEHDVANVLKRFVRQLEEPLLTDYLKDSFLKAAAIKDLDQKLTRYKNLLHQLPAINFATMRKLLGHLNTVAEQCDKNLMPVYNLAPLWGPNILIVDKGEKDFGETSGETEVCAELISNYPYLFDVDMEELDKEKKLLEVLEKINYPTPSSLKRSGDVRMWCYIESRTAGKCVSISLHPTLTAGEAILMVAKEAQLLDIQGMLIHEVVLGECLERPVHYSEKMLDLTLRWGDWEDIDRHNNYLVLKSNKLYADALPCAIPPLSIFSEIQFSDNKPKSRFSKFLFSVSSASITCYKEDKNGQTSEFNAWPVEDIIWYIGCEKKRSTPHPLNLTFISKLEPVRSKETPFFGRVLSFTSRELFTKWIAALLVAEYGTDIVQSNLVILD